MPDETQDTPNAPDAAPPDSTPPEPGRETPPDAAPPTPATPALPAGETPPETFAAWLEEQPEAVQTLVADHIAGLKKALDEERKGRRALEKQLREAAAQLEEGSQARQTLDEVTAGLEAANRKAAFYEEASRPEHRVADLALAWLVVSAAERAESDLFDRKGNVDFDALKRHHPTLFKTTATPPAHAGAGAGQPPVPQADMNAFIRRAAGRNQ